MSGQPTGAGGRFARATSIPRYVALVREAESRLIAAGVGDADDRIRVLSGLYYGTPWSTDFDVEQSEVRNAAFQIYTARFGPGDDPRPVLGLSLFRALKRSQDVAGVDMGHVIIGLNARSSWTSRSVPIPTQGATGLEITTWVGDLGGAAARLAKDRVRAPHAGPARYFRGTDYGAASNLEGDIAAYLVAARPDTDEAAAPRWPASGMIADALAEHFADRTARADRYRRFLILQGGDFGGRSLLNRDEVEAGMAAKLAAFGRWYLANYLRQRGQLSVDTLLAAEEQLDGAAQSVAAHFVGWLLARVRGG